MNYPGGIKPKKNINVDNTNYANRGMNLEYDINLSNEFYKEKNIAFIYKKPTPIKISKVKYSAKNAIITEAFFEKPSTTDYNGLYKGCYIDFEAKETNSTTAFPLANIHKHQIEHIKNIVNNKGICFLIVRFNKKNKDFLLLGKDLIEFVSNNNRKSIPYDFFINTAFEIKYGLYPRIDYLKIINDLYGGVLSEN